VRRLSFLLLIAVLTLTAVAFSLWVYPSPTDFAPSNPYWNGLREARRKFDMKSLHSLSLLPGEARGTVLVVIPRVPATAGDLEAFVQYVGRGGMMVLMDDFGYGNAILAHLGVGARLSGQKLVDPLFNHKNRRLPMIFEFPGGLASEGVRSLVLNHATAIEEAGGMTVAAISSAVSYLDANGNGWRDPDEEGGPFAVAAVGRVGAGHLVLVSDSSILLNSMLEMADNRRFVQDLFRLAGEGAQIYLDQAHLPGARLDVAKEGLARLREFLGNPLVAFAAAGVGLALPVAVLLRLFRR
jgi:hypothetical protein